LALFHDDDDDDHGGDDDEENGQEEGETWGKGRRRKKDCFILLIHTVFSFIFMSYFEAQRAMFVSAWREYTTV
jgi:hypothetical protein